MDIVESLRRAAVLAGCQNPLAQKEAADEIERLREQIDAVVKFPPLTDG